MKLQRGRVLLRPLSPADAPQLFPLLDPVSWAGMAHIMPRSEAETRTHIGALIARENSLDFAVEFDGRFVGTTCLYDIFPGLKAEIGNTYYAHDVRGTEVNPTCKLLLLSHAFEILGVQRAALRADHRNVRSRNAILRMGATFEGTLRSFRPSHDGTLADVDYFSILAHEWPAVKEGLEARLLPPLPPLASATEILA